MKDTEYDLIASNYNELADEAKNQADAAYFKPEIMAEKLAECKTLLTGLGAKNLDDVTLRVEEAEGCSDPMTADSAASPSTSASSEAASAETQSASPSGFADLMNAIQGKTIIVKDGDDILKDMTSSVLQECRDAYDAARLPTSQATPAGMPADGPSVAPVASEGQGVATTPPASSVPQSGLAARLAARIAASQNATPIVKGKLTPTDEQKAIIDLAYGIMTRKIDSDVGVFEAGAGTGKTATFRMLADILPGTGQYVTFTAALTKESQVKFHGTKVQCNTIHSLAFRAIGHKFSDRLNGPRIRSERVAQMLNIKVFSVRRTTIDEATGEHSTKPHNLAPGFLASQVMGAIRKFCMSADKEVTAEHFKYIDGLDLPAPDGRRTFTCNNQVREYLLPFAHDAWKDLCQAGDPEKGIPSGHLPFIHDHYVKMWELDNPVISANYLLSDESQDISPVMLSIFQQQDIPKFLVGDSAQSIYEWRGAVNAMAAFPGAPRLFLSQSFRFGQAIADVANAILETLEEATPLRLKGFDQINSVVAPMTEYKAVLCRTNAVAVGRLLAAIAEGKAPFLVGGGADVIAFVKAAKELQQGLPTNHPELACFESWPGVQAYVKEDEGEDLKLLVNLIDAFGCDPIISALD